MAVKNESTVEVIRTMSPAELGLPKGATVRQMLDRMAELELRPLTADEVLRMELARPVEPIGDGQSLSVVSSAHDHDPIIPGVLLDGKPVRQSELKKFEGCRSDEPDPNELVWVDEHNKLVEVTPDTDMTGLTQVKRSDHEAFRDWP